MASPFPRVVQFSEPALAAVGSSRRNEVGSPATQNPQLRRAYAAPKATNADKAHPWRQEMVHGTVRRMQGSSVRGDNDEDGENGHRANGEHGDSRGDNCDGIKVVEKEMGDKGFRDGCSHTSRRRGLCIGENSCHPGVEDRELSNLCGLREEALCVPITPQLVLGGVGGKQSKLKN